MIQISGEKFDKLADVVVKIGLNLQPGQRLMMIAPIAQAPLARNIVAKAYQAGARLVDVMWTDDELSLTRFNHAPRDSFEEVPQWRYDEQASYMEAGDAMLAFVAINPNLLAGQDVNLAGQNQQARMRGSAAVSHAIATRQSNWCAFPTPVTGWNELIFPLLSEEAAEEQMWKNIFAMCRIDEPDPVTAWESHLNDLARRRDYLNAKQYTTLKYTGPGTDLTIGLPQNHIWVTASTQTKGGIKYVINMPTEEVWTLPHRERVDGHVTSTKPLSVSGQTIEDFELTFEKGRVVKATAKRGEENLNNLIQADENARFLGEVALVPHSSPISQTGLVFNNPLIDENAACHLALGNAYKYNLRDGEEMSDADFAAAGGNISNLHMDFMIGSGELNIDGVTADGTTEPVFRSGEWAFEE